MFLDYKAYSIEAYDTHHPGWKVRITRRDGQNHEDALAEAKKLIDDGGMN
jgi:hypothetical protein